MLDVACITMMVLCFLAAAGYTRFCERLRGAERNA